MMEGHEMSRTTKKPKPYTTTAKPNSYDDQSFGEDFGYNGQASAKIESVYKYVPSNSFRSAEKPQHQIKSGIPEYKYPIKKQQQAQQKIGQNQPYEIISFRREYKKAPLDGPMVVKVHLDGTPVEETIIVEDEDLKHYKLLQQGLPTFQ